MVLKEKQLLSFRKLLSRLKLRPNLSHSLMLTHLSSFHVCATWFALRWATASTSTVIGLGLDSTSAPWIPDHLQTTLGSAHKIGSLR